MARLYTEIRVSHNSLEEKKEFESKLKTQANKVDSTIIGYIRLVVALDTATSIIQSLKNNHEIMSKIHEVKGQLELLMDKDTISPIALRHFNKNESK